MPRILQLIGMVLLIAAVIFPLIRFLMGQATKAGQNGKPWLAFVLVSLQFLIFFVGFTTMMFLALVYISTQTDLF